MSEQNRGEANSERRRIFALGDVLSITTGKLVSPRHIEGVYDILNFMTGDNLYTHQLPRVSRECAPHLLKQHPQLADVDASNVNKDNLQAWMRQLVEKYGPTLYVVALQPGEHYQIEPLSELAEMVHPDKIISVTVKS